MFSRIIKPLEKHTGEMPVPLSFLLHWRIDESKPWAFRPASAKSPQSVMAMRLLRRVRSKLVELAVRGKGNQHCWTRWFDQGKADQGRRRHFRSFHRFDCFSTRRG